MSSTILKTFFPNFEEVYGHTDSLKVVLQSQSAPLVTIKEDTSEINTNAVVKFLNPFNDEFETIAIDVNLTIGMSLELQQKFTITGKVENIKIVVNDVKTYF